MSDLNQLKEQILADGIIDAAEVKQIEGVIYADGKIDQEEADFMFALNDAVTGKANDSGWAQLFTKALTDFVLNDDGSPGALDDDECAYIIEKIQGDGKVDDQERALLVSISTNAESTPEAFQNFVFKSFKEAILEDGVIDEHEVSEIKAIIYGTGGADGLGISRSEADWLFDLNDAVSGKDNHASWSELMVAAISSHVLEDEDSPGVVDAAEVTWLKARIMNDGNVDDVEQAILDHVKFKAKSIDGELA